MLAPVTQLSAHRAPQQGNDETFTINSKDLVEQHVVNAIIKESYRIDPSIKDFLIHEDDVVRVVCSRGTKKLAELFTPSDENVSRLMAANVTKNAILYFVLCNLMGATNSEQLEARRTELVETLRRKTCYNGSTRLQWGTSVRVTLFLQGRGKLAIVGRVAPQLVPPIDAIGLPHQAAAALRGAQRGLVLITGPMSAGKTRTAQTILNHRNMNTGGHIVTIEDPIETELKSDKCLITTKEVGVDTASFAEGLRDALRQAADILFIGEMRDKETVKAAINASGSGLLVVATVHGDTCAMALTRMMSLLGEEATGYWGVLSQSLICILRQALIPTADGKGWVMVSDAVLNGGAAGGGVGVSALLGKGDLAGLESYTAGATKGARSGEEDWISMNDAMRKLVAAQKISPAAARKAATDPKGLAM